LRWRARQSSPSNLLALRVLTHAAVQLHSFTALDGVAAARSREEEEVLTTLTQIGGESAERCRIAFLLSVHRYHDAYIACSAVRASDEQDAECLGRLKLELEALNAVGLVDDERTASEATLSSVTEVPGIASVPPPGSKPSVTATDQTKRQSSPHRGGLLFAARNGFSATPHEVQPPPRAALIFGQNRPSVHHWA